MLDNNIERIKEEINIIDSKIEELNNKIQDNTKLNLIGQKVKQNKYGEGTILEQNENKIKIEFKNVGEKTFDIEVVLVNKSLIFNDNTINNKISIIKELANTKKQLEEDKKEKELELDKLFKEQYKNDINIKQKSEQLVSRICNEILNGLENSTGFYARPTKYSCIQVSKPKWWNEETKGLHYEVWCQNIYDENLFGSKNVEVKIGFHIEGRNPKVINIINELAKYNIYRTDRYIVEQEIKYLKFDSEQEIEKSINIIIECVKKLDNKYTKNIDEVI